MKKRTKFYKKGDVEKERVDRRRRYKNGTNSKNPKIKNVIHQRRFEDEEDT